MCLYVDDILIFGTDLEAIMETKVVLSKNLDMKDLGEADVILNIKLIKGEDGITLSQSHYVEKVLTRFGHMDGKPVTTPYDPSYTLSKHEGKPVNQLLYSQIIRSLMYLNSATRLDISYAVCRLDRYSSSLGDRHWVALYRALRYLKGVMNLGIKYTGYSSVLEGFSDANWIFVLDQMKSTSGYVFTLAGGAVSWRSSKQSVSTRSTKEAELVALDSAALEAEWLRDLLSDLPMLAKPIPAVLVYCDNTSVLLKVNSRKDNKISSRHIRR
jgi:hypothetical protein